MVSTEGDVGTVMSSTIDRGALSSSKADDLEGELGFEATVLLSRSARCSPLRRLGPCAPARKQAMQLSSRADGDGYTCGRRAATSASGKRRANCKVWSQLKPRPSYPSFYPTSLSPSTPRVFIIFDGGVDTSESGLEPPDDGRLFHKAGVGDVQGLSSAIFPPFGASPMRRCL